ncbi:MAG TPA: hypothetical protein VL651_00460 [Bacteroidia bacterium]|jgi:hypothetical protein|nr:hypothetical protein [Bacteroidia bacterium]
MRVSLKTRRILLLICFLWVVGFIFIPIRKDLLTGQYTGNTPETSVLSAQNEVVSSSLAIGFNGHPAGILGIILFALMPFFIVWESFSLKRPFSYPAQAFLKLQSLLCFLGAPYTYYMITYQNGNFSDSIHHTQMGEGGYILFVQNILVAIFLFGIVGNQKGKWAQFFDERK